MKKIILVTLLFLTACSPQLGYDTDCNPNKDSAVQSTDCNSIRAVHGNLVRFNF